MDMSGDQKRAPTDADAVQFLDDQPASIDLLNYRPYAIALSRIIGNAETRTPFIVGVLGRWGSGKTTLMRLIETELTEQKVTTVWLNAWPYAQADEIWAAFLQALSRRLAKQLGLGEKFRFSARLLEGGIAWNQLIYKAPGYVVGLILVAVPAIVGTVLQDHVGAWFGKFLASAGITGSALLGAWYLLRPTAEAFRKEVLPEISLVKPMDFEKRVSTLDGFREQFERMLSALPSSKRRVVLFVDDIDRCSPEKALQLLDAIKVLLDIESCVFVLGLDIAVIQQALQAKYPADPIAQREYIAKIIQLPFHLPPLTIDDLTAYLRSLRVRFPDDRCLEVFLATLGRNPREIKRVINIYSLVWSLAQTARSGLKPVRLAKVVALQQAFDSLFRQLRDQPEWLGMLERAVRPWEAQTLVFQPDVTVVIGGSGQGGVPPAISAFVTDPVIVRMLTMHPLLAKGHDDANFGNLSAAELSLYFTVTKRLTLTEQEDELEPGSAPRSYDDANLFDDRYMLGELLATGGVGRVYAAEDRISGRKVAIKRLSETLAQDHRWVRRFLSESILLERVGKHPNIAAVYATGTTRNSEGRNEPYIVMELLSGETLRGILDRQKRLNLTDVRTFLLPLLDALEFIHQAGVVHRDIKPSNILVGQDHRARLIDFGIAIAADDVQDDFAPDGQMIGTPAYMSPEQFTGQSADAKSDLYSFGIVLFESITGHNPMTASLADRLQAPIPRVTKFVKDIPVSLESVVAKLLALRPDDRFPTAYAARLALDEALPY